MTAIVTAPSAVSVEDYLRVQRSSECKHEYIGGQLYAMTGASIAHNMIALNIAAALKNHLRGGPCQVFVSDVKVRLSIAEQDIFYYPDVFIACRMDDSERYYRRFPNTIIEVLSDATEQIDRREKFLAYQTIESLQEYVIVAQDEQRIIVFERGNDWRAREIGADGVLNLASLAFNMPVDQVYEGVGASPAAKAP